MKNGEISIYIKYYIRKHNCLQDMSVQKLKLSLMRQLIWFILVNLLHMAVFNKGNYFYIIYYNNE